MGATEVRAYIPSLYLSRLGSMTPHFFTCWKKPCSNIHMEFHKQKLLLLIKLVEECFRWRHSYIIFWYTASLDSCQHTNRSYVYRLLFSHSVASDSLRPHGRQHASLPCPSLSPGLCSNSCPLSQGCHPSSHPLSPPSLLLLPSILPSIRVFSNESVLCIRWPKYWSFSFSISLSNEHSGLIHFRIDWFGLLAVQGTLKSLHHICVCMYIAHIWTKL